MISSHIAHDCVVGSNVIIANNVPLGGHVTIEDNVVVKDLVEIIYFENNYAYVSGTLKENDLIVLGGAAKIIEGKKIN